MLIFNGTRYYGEVLWTPEDVMELAPSMTRDQAEEWLFRNEGYIQAAMTQRGFDTLEALLRDMAPHEYE